MKNKTKAYLIHSGRHQSELRNSETHEVIYRGVGALGRCREMCRVHAEENNIQIVENPVRSTDVRSTVN